MVFNRYFGSWQIFVTNLILNADAGEKAVSTHANINAGALRVHEYINWLSVYS